MKQDNFIKMGPDYVAWASTTTKDEVMLLDVLGSEGVRKVCNYKVVVKDLLDTLLFRCHGLRKAIQPDLEDMEPDDIKLYLANNEPTITLENYTVTLDNKHYMISFPVKELEKLFKINRRNSTWKDVKKSRNTVLDIDTMLEVIEKVIAVSIVKVSARTGVLNNQKGVGALVTKAYIENNIAYFYLDSDIADLLTPDNHYNCKYLTDSLILGSEYCKNFHAFVSYFADVFRKGKFYNGRKYEFTAIETVAKMMGVRLDTTATKYNKETHAYPRVDVVQMVKKYVKEVNEKTRIPQLYGKLTYDIIRRQDSTKKVKGFKFYFEKEKNNANR